MRHAIKKRKLGRTSAHRTAMFRNQLASLFEHGRIRTTLPKAKELRPIAERLITRSREDSVHARRMVRRWLPENQTLIKKLFEEIGPRFTDRPGGYLRILKMGPRPGDAAEMALVEFVDYEPVAAEPEEKKTKQGKQTRQSKKKK